MKGATRLPRSRFISTSYLMSAQQRAPLREEALESIGLYCAMCPREKYPILETLVRPTSATPR